MGVRTGDTRPQKRDNREWTSQSLRLPKFSALDVDAAEARKLQLFGQSILGAVAAWEHRKLRRQQGRAGGDK